MARTFDVSMLRLIVLYFQSQYGVDFVKSDKSNKIQTFYLFHKSHNGAPLWASSGKIPSVFKEMFTKIISYLQMITNRKACSLYQNQVVVQKI